MSSITQRCPSRVGLLANVVDGALVRDRGFTLLELVIVITITAIIVVVASLRMHSSGQRARIASTQASFRAFVSALETYRAEHQTLPADRVEGQMPIGMRRYMRPAAWSTPAPIGGAWDWNGAGWRAGQPLGMSIIWPSAATPALWLRFDEVVDDGSFSTGIYRRYNNSAKRHLQIDIEP